MTRHGMKVAALIVGISAFATALMVGSIVLGQVLFPGWVGGLAALSICLVALFLMVAWAASR